MPFMSLPKAAPAAEPGVLLAQYHDGDSQRFFLARANTAGRDKYNWVNLPMPEEERVIRDEWEHWRARRWGR
jgi:hypothetical protein